MSVDRKNITGYVKHTYKAYFKVKLGYQDRSLAPINTTGIKYNNQHSLQYPNFHLSAIQLLTAKKFLYQRSWSFLTATTRPPVQTREDIQKRSYKAQDGPQPFSHCELNNLVKNFSLSKTSSKLLYSHLKEKNLLGEDASITFFCRRLEDYIGYFCQEENLVSC